MKSVVGVVLLDFSAAFDIIDHELIHLVNRKQCVMFNGSLSSVETLQCGVPQGSCLGPLLYSIFVNDMPYVLKNAGMGIYADDTTMYVSSESIEQVNEVLQLELKLVSEWILENKLKLNVLKTKCMVIGSKYSLRTDQRLSLSLKGYYYGAGQRSQTVGCHY